MKESCFARAETARRLKKKTKKQKSLRIPRGTLNLLKKKKAKVKKAQDMANSDSSNEDTARPRIKRRRTKEPPHVRREKDRVRKKKKRAEQAAAAAAAAAAADAAIQQQEFVDVDDNREEAAGAQIDSSDSSDAEDNVHLALSPAPVQGPAQLPRPVQEEGNRAEAALRQIFEGAVGQQSSSSSSDNDEEGLVPLQREPRGFPAERTAEESFALKVAGIKGSSHISDQAINKLFALFVEERGNIDYLVRTRKIRPSYTNCLRPMAIRHIPRVYSAVVLEETDGEVKLKKRIADLDKIPKRVLNLPNDGNLRVLREESYVTLRSIKEHHEKIHVSQGMALETVREQYKSCVLSIDGVEETRKGKKTFHVISLQIGGCIYIYRVLNPLVKDKAAKLNLEDVLR